MATGDITAPKRPRYAANERFDSGDADAASRTSLEHIEAFQRSLLTTPRAAGGTLPTGLIFTGFSLTLNPTGPNDNKVRINTEVGIAVTANGRLVIKPAGVTVDITIPSGSQQLYVYWQETSGETAQRRFLTVSAPFVEYSAAMDTVWQATYGTWVRAGTATNIVPDDTVNGVTTPLVCLGVVTNTAGAITSTGYHSVNAPNGTAIVNRLSAVNQPTTLPTRYKNGSAQTIRDLIVTNAYIRGRSIHLGGNNGAASTPLLAYSGTSTAVGFYSLTDAAATWTVNELTSCILKDSAGNWWWIASNTATALSLAFGWPNGGTPYGSATLTNPIAGAYNIYGPVANNNFGAYAEPSRSLERQADLWDAYFSGAGHLVMPDKTHISLTGDAYVQQAGTLFLGTQKFTANGTYTPTTGTRRVKVRLCGGGGGGSGVSASPTGGRGACGSGGASGVYVEAGFTGAPITGGAVVVGAAGTGGASSGAETGGTGGDSSIVINGTTVTAKGGLGGQAGGQDLGPPAARRGGLSQAGSYGSADVNHCDLGAPGILAGNAGDSLTLGGNGGSGRLGVGGAGSEQGAGGAGSWFGAGGGGASNWQDASGYTGGAGAQGVVFVDEYY